MNLFRALEADEDQLLDSVRDRQLADEDACREVDADEPSHFKASAPSLLGCIFCHQHLHQCGRGAQGAAHLASSHSS
jgi:hypothetical protein